MLYDIVLEMTKYESSNTCVHPHQFKHHYTPGDLPGTFIPLRNLQQYRYPHTRRVNSSSLQMEEAACNTDNSNRGGPRLFLPSHLPPFHSPLGRSFAGYPTPNNDEMVLLLLIAQSQTPSRRATTDYREYCLRAQSYDNDELDRGRGRDLKSLQ